MCMAHTEINNNVQFTETLTTWPTGCVDLKLVVPSQGNRSPHPYPAASGAEWIRTMAKLLPIYSMIVKALSDLGKLKARMYQKKGTGHRDAEARRRLTVLTVVISPRLVLPDQAQWAEIQSQKHSTKQAKQESSLNWLLEWKLLGSIPSLPWKRSTYQ